MLKDKEIIFIFTKDRPKVLNETLGHLKNFDDRVFIIDDSYYELNQKGNRELLKLLPNANYYGKSEFNESAILHNLGSHKFKSIYKQLGNAEWNLGYARNYALFLSKIHNAYKVLFMDDDIVLPKEDNNY